MALITTIDEIKEVLPKLVSNLNSTSLLPNFDAVEQKYIVPLIGNALYQDLTDRYKTDNLNNPEQQLVKHLRLIVAAYGFLDELPAAHVTLTDDGVRTMDTQAMPKAVGWEYKELKAFLQTRALDGTEVVLNYLWKNKSTFTLWADSDECKQFESLLIRTGTDFNEQYRLYQPMRTYYLLKSLTEDVQGYYLLSALGKDLLHYFIQLESPGEEEKAIIKYLKKGLAYLTVKFAAEHYNVRFNDGGFTVISTFGGDRDTDDSGRSTASAQQLQLKMNACRRDGESFIARAKSAIVKLRADSAVSADFIVAFDAGPLKSYIDPATKTKGNEKRKVFRF